MLDVAKNNEAPDDFRGLVQKIGMTDIRSIF